jgi:PAS domain S-box-containing protein
VIIVATVFAVTRHWDLAQTLINYILYASALVAVYYYLLNRSLYKDSEKKTTELKKEQREIKARQETIDLIFQNSADGILILDQDKRIEEFSPGMEKMTGYAREEAIGHIAEQLLKFHSSESNSILPDLMFTISSPKKDNPFVKNSLVSKDGKNVDIEASYALINDPKTGKAKSMAIIRDISYEKALTERDKEFIAVTSHQLNTPLSIIRGYSSLLFHEKAGPISVKQKDYLQEIHQACEKMVSLTGNLLSISRIEQEKIKLQISEINMVDLIKKVTESVKDRIKSLSAEFKVNIEKKNLIISADLDKLYQAIVNVVDNALKYTPKGTVCLSVCDQGNNVAIIVKDTGIGIPEDQIDKIGQRFFRTQEAIDIDPKGTGLGIYIAKSIILKHGGQFEIKSQKGKGAEVKMTLPKSSLAINTNLEA